MLEELKLLAESLILDSDLNSKNKRMLLKFVGESSSKEDIKSLILDGSPSQILENDTKNIINLRFENLIENLVYLLEIEKPGSEKPKRKLPISPMSLIYTSMYLPTNVKAGILAKIKMALAAGGGYMGGTALAALLGFIAYKVYQNYLSKAAQSCKDNPNKAECIENFKKKAKLIQIQQLQKGLAQCAKSKDPDKCRQSIVNKINKLRSG